MKLMNFLSASVIPWERKFYPDWTVFKFKTANVATAPAIATVARTSVVLI